MKISDLTVEVRDSSLARVGQILPADLIGLELALRYNKVGAWKLSLRSDHPLADALRAPGAGLIVTGPTGVILSGPTIQATNNKTADDPVGKWDIVGADDSVILGERVAYPVPTTADLSLQTAAYDTRTGKAETVAKAYVNANIGPSAAAARKISTLTIDTDLGRGNTVTGNARFDTLGSLCESLLSTSSLGFDVIQSGSNLVFKVFQPTDRSAEIRMDVDNLRLESSSYSYTKPEATRVIVGGSGEGAARVLVERSSSASTAAESAWGRRIEVFKDSSSTSDTTTLQQAGDEILTDKGKTIEAVSVKPSDDQTMRYGVDWGLGDKITVVVGSSQISQIVTEVAIVVTDEGIKVGATVGDPVTASAGDSDTAVLSAQSDQEARITALETNDVTSDGAITTAKLANGSVTSAKIADGTIVDADISSSAAIATSKVSGLDAALASKANLSGASFSGQISVPQGSGVSLNGAGNGYVLGTSYDGYSWQSNNVMIQSWYGIGFGPSISGQSVPINESAVIINTRTGELAARSNISGARFYTGSGQSLPYRVQVGTINISTTNSASMSATVSGLSGFSAAPYVFCIQSSIPGGSGTLTTKTTRSAATTSVLQVYAYTGNGANVTLSGVEFTWMAIQP